MNNDSFSSELAKRELARRHYADYLAYAYGESWMRTKLSSFLADRIQSFIETNTGHSYDILIIECPPQHGKSMTVSESLPSWYLGRYPEHNIILASYDSDFAERFCRKNKEKIKSCGRTLFNIGIGSIDRAGEFELNNGKGRMISRGIMSGITGNPANVIIIDDPVKNQQEADSPAYRNRVWSEWQASLKSRLAANGKVILIMTPWTDDDLAARILKSEKNVQLVRLPVEAEENDPMGREKGAPLCPELGKDAQWLVDFKASYISDPQGGQRAWTALYQCSPRSEEGNLVRREWWRFYIPRNYISAHPQLADSSQPRSDSSVRVNSFEAQIGTWREKANCAETGAAHAGSALSALSVGYSPDDPVAEGANHIPDAAAAHEPAAQFGIRNFGNSSSYSPGAGSESEAECRLREPGRTETVEEPETYGTEIISVDASFKGDDTSDFVSIQVWGKRAQDYFLRYCLNKRLNFPETVQAIKTVYQLFPRARTVLIEEAANGPAIIQTLQREMFIIPVSPLGGKVSRVNAISPAIESGHVYLPDPGKAPWVADFIDQWTAFPIAKHDDMVDAASQALNRMIYCSGEVWEEQPKPENSYDFVRMYDPYNTRRER